MSKEHSGVPEHVLRAGAAAAVSPALLEAVRSSHASSPVGDPARGQLWRTTWDQAALLVLVIRVTVQGTAAVAPVTVDPPASDEMSVVVSPELTVLGHAATIWGGLTIEIPFSVFDMVIGGVMPAALEAVELMAAGDNQGKLPAGTRAGDDVGSLFDTSAGVRAELSDTLELLHGAVWAPLVTRPVKYLRELLADQVDIAGLMKALTQALGVKQPEVMSMLKGTRPVLPEQAPIVAHVTGLSEQQVLSAVPPLPADLVRELDRPLWRNALRAQRLPGESDTAVRLKVAYGTLALAARQTGPASANSWPERIRQYLATHPRLDTSHDRDAS
jgi:DNA-binding transcriptional regulator YdaS (Cro superfamily)